MRRCQAASLEEAREEGQEDPASRGPRASVCATNETIKINRRPRRAEMSRNLQLTTRTSCTLRKMLYQNPIENVRFLVGTLKFFEFPVCYLKINIFIGTFNGPKSNVFYKFDFGI